MEKANQKKHLILIADDNKLNLEFLEDALQHKYNIGTAENGQEAFDFARKHRPNLILLDIMMPVMDGYEVIRQLKETSQTKNIAVIFITGLAEGDKIVKGLELGAHDYITKPFMIEEVEARIETHLALDDYKNRLEEKVLERTRDLEKAHQRLQKMEGLLTSVQTATHLNEEISGHLSAIIRSVETNQPSEDIIAEVKSISALISEIVDKVSSSYNEFAAEEVEEGHDDFEKKEF